MNSPYSNPRFFCQSDCSGDSLIADNKSDTDKPVRQPIAVSVPEAALLAGVSRSTLYNEMAAGKLPWAKIGKRRLIPMRCLLEWLDAAIKDAA